MRKIKSRKEMRGAVGKLVEIPIFSSSPALPSKSDLEKAEKKGLRFNFKKGIYEKIKNQKKEN
jgi:hypothetical protein